MLLADIFIYLFVVVNKEKKKEKKKKRKKKKKEKKNLCRQFQWMKKEFTGTTVTTVESVSDNLNNEDLAWVAGGLLFFWYDFFLDSYSKGYCANSVSASLQHLRCSNSYFVNHKTTPKKPPATQTYEDLVAACQMWAKHRWESNYEGSLLSRARDVHLLFGREFTACNFSVSITIIIVNYYRSKVNYYHSRAHHVTCK